MSLQLLILSQTQLLETIPPRTFLHHLTCDNGTALSNNNRKALTKVTGNTITLPPKNILFDIIFCNKRSTLAMTVLLIIGLSSHIIISDGIIVFTASERGVTAQSVSGKFLREILNLA